MIQSITPYLILPGRAREAAEFYAGAVDAKTVTMNRFGDIDGSCPEAIKDRIMHGELRIGEAMLMLSDGASSDDAPDAPGKVSLAVAASNAADMRTKFKALAASGKVIQEIFPAPWGGLYGAVVDKFGVSWMWTCTEKD